MKSKDAEDEYISCVRMEMYLSYLLNGMTEIRVNYTSSVRRISTYPASTFS